MLSSSSCALSIDFYENILQKQIQNQRRRLNELLCCTQKLFNLSVVFAFQYLVQALDNLKYTVIVLEIRSNYD